MSFQIIPLPNEPFQHLFRLNSEQLAAHNAIRMSVDRKPGFPCRISLADADIGEDVILVHYEHQNANSPFRSSHAIFIRANADTPQIQPGSIPDMLRSRVISLRGFNRQGMMISADLADGQLLEPSIEAIFQNSEVDYIHLHFAKPGCFAARVNRA